MLRPHFNSHAHAIRASRTVTNPRLTAGPLTRHDTSWLPLPVHVCMPSTLSSTTRTLAHSLPVAVPQSCYMGKETETQHCHGRHSAIHTAPLVMLRRRVIPTAGTTLWSGLRRGLCPRLGCASQSRLPPPPPPLLPHHSIRPTTPPALQSTPSPHSLPPRPSLLPWRSLHLRRCYISPGGTALSSVITGGCSSLVPCTPCCGPASSVCCRAWFGHIGRVFPLYGCIISWSTISRAALGPALMVCLHCCRLFVFLVRARLAFLLPSTLTNCVLTSSL